MTAALGASIVDDRNRRPRSPAPAPPRPDRRRRNRPSPRQSSVYPSASSSLALAPRALVLDPSDSGSSGRSRNVGRQSQLVISDPNEVARVQLPAAALLSFSVHP